MYTRPDRGVAICYPTPWNIAVLTGWGWPDIIPIRDRLIANAVRAGRSETEATRWINALIAGQKTDAEALELVAERAVPKDAAGTEVWDVADLPRSRWYRNAWRRSRNGGPISIDLEAAKALDLFRIPRVRKKAIEESEAQREDAIMAGSPLVSRLEQIKDIDLAALGRSIRGAQSLFQLRRLWPRVLPMINLAPAPQTQAARRPN